MSTQFFTPDETLFTKMILQKRMENPLYELEAVFGLGIPKFGYNNQLNRHLFSTVLDNLRRDNDFIYEKESVSLDIAVCTDNKKCQTFLRFSLQTLDDIKRYCKDNVLLTKPSLEILYKDALYWSDQEKSTITRELESSDTLLQSKIVNDTHQKVRINLKQEVPVTIIQNNQEF